MDIKHSILLICYNQEHCIKNALDSIVNQTEKPYEVIVSDDCSSDATFKIVKEYKENYPDLFVINSNETNLGIHGNVQKILSLVRGNLVSFCAGDDYYEKDLVESVNKIIVNEKVDLENERFVLITHSMQHYKNGYQELKINSDTSYDFFKAMLRKHYTFTKIGISKKVFDDAEYPSNIGLWADWAWDVNMAKKVTRTLFVDKYFYNFNVAVGITSKTKEKDLVASYVKVAEYLLEKFKEQLDFWDRLFLQLEISSCKYQLNSSVLNYIKFFGLFIININNLGTSAAVKSHLAKLLPDFIVKIIQKKKG